MEDKIKNFDRSIEQMMNESAVPPPFGMWNRISADLDAVPTVAPANTLLPKSALIGLIAGVVILGGVLTASLFSRTAVKEDAPVNVMASISNQPELPAVISVLRATEAKVTPAQKEEVAPVVKPAPVVARAVISKPVETNPGVAKQESAPPSLNATNSNSDVSAPTQSTAETIGVVVEPYYFPPIDINVTGKANETAVVTHPAKVISDASDKTDEEVKATPAKEQKLHFKPKKHKKFMYGKIIRQK